MECYTDFRIECKTDSAAEQVAETMKKYFEKKGLSDHYLVKRINVFGSVVKQDRDFWVMDFWGDIFKEMCDYVDSQYPGLIIRGESNYEESTGMRTKISFEGSDDGISFSEMIDDFDMISFMIEDGMEPEEIAKITGLPIETIEEYISEYEEWDEGEEEDVYGDD